MQQGGNVSLNSLASSRVARERAQRPVLETTADVVGGDQLQNALSALIEYVPAETITLYIAVGSALPVLQQEFPQVTPGFVYWAFALLTPLLYALIYCGKRRAHGQ